MPGQRAARKRPAQFREAEAEVSKRAKTEDEAASVAAASVAPIGLAAAVGPVAAAASLAPVAPAAADEDTDMNFDFASTAGPLVFSSAHSSTAWTTGNAHGSAAKASQLARVDMTEVAQALSVAVRDPTKQNMEAVMGAANRDVDTMAELAVASFNTAKSSSILLAAAIKNAHQHINQQGEESQDEVGKFWSSVGKLMHTVHSVLGQKIEDLGQKIDAKARKIDELGHRVEINDRKLEELEQKLEGLVKANEAKDKKLDALEAANASLVKKLHEAHQKLEQIQASFIANLTGELTREQLLEQLQKLRID